MRDDQVVGRIFKRMIGPALGQPGPCVRYLGADAGAVLPGSPDQRLEHCGTGVYGVYPNSRIGLQQPRGETTVAVAQNHRITAGADLSQEGATGPPEPRAKTDQDRKSVV